MPRSSFSVIEATLRRQLAQRGAVLVDDVGERHQEPAGLGVQVARQLVDRLRHACHLVDGVGEARRGLALEHVAGLGPAERSVPSVSATKRSPLRARKSSLATASAPDCQVAVDRHRDPDAVALELQVLDPSRAQPRQPDVGAAVEPCTSRKVGGELAGPAEEAEPDGQLDRHGEESECRPGRRARCVARC